MNKDKIENNLPFIEIEMFPAGHGDSLLVQMEMEDKEKINLIIDCGLVSTFRDTLKQKLKELNCIFRRL